ncbi:hypothetical protein CYY_006732 [Polysphondylium violaceum]|uniref:COMM domain-containing protein 1 n=1 Tax=Polysphondylium violaceum TaxID=133409 RepID=A0A8J4V2V2_9MYCE|nr:hypothetical protein CYY_006732 [Polysphondylium violaceum]
MNNPKLFSNILGFLLNKEYEDDTLTIETLHEMVFSETDVSLENVEAMYDKCKQVLKKAIYLDHNITSFETLVKEDFTDVQQECFIKFWKINKKKIHEIIYKKTRFNNSLDKINWRIDLKTKSKNVNEMNEPVSIVELKLKNNNNKLNSNNIIKFEMDKSQLEETLQQINNIQKHLQSKSMAS